MKYRCHKTACTRGARSNHVPFFIRFAFLSICVYLFHSPITFRSNENVYLFQFTATEISKICSLWTNGQVSEWEKEKLSQPNHLMLVSISLCMIEMCIIFALFTKKEGDRKTRKREQRTIPNKSSTNRRKVTSMTMAQPQMNLPNRRNELFWLLRKSLCKMCNTI